MTSMKTTKKSLLISALALLLCFAMLIGTTFAWFTDSVSSANNIIASGNLDIELEYAVFNDDGTVKEWKTVNGTTDLFEDVLWEPGHTDVVYLRLKNIGSLALKYELAINIVSETPGINMAGEDGDYYHCRQCKHFERTEDGKYGAIVGYCKFNKMKRSRYGANRACKKFELNDHQIIGSFLANQITGKD